MRPLVTFQSRGLSWSGSMCVINACPLPRHLPNIPGMRSMRRRRVGRVAVLECEPAVAAVLPGADPWWFR